MAWLGIEGHDTVRDFFAQVLQTGRLAHAYLFHGPAGIGKRRVALALAQTLQCRQVPVTEMNPCGSCPDCRQLLAGTHPDVIQVAKPEEKVEFPIDLVREQIIRGLSLKPAQGRYKIVLVDDADAFSPAAANCLLKTLEEPPENSLLILLAVSPELLLPTIRSRCQQVAFRPLPTETIERILLDQQLVSDPAQARYCAWLAEGSVTEALLLASEQVQRVKQQLLSAMLAPKLHAADLLEAVDEMLGSAEASAAARRRVASILLRLALALFRSALRTAAGAGAAERELLDERERRAVEKLAEQAGMDRLLRMIERTLVAEQQNLARAHVPLLLEAWACAMADIVSPPPLTAARR